MEQKILDLEPADHERLREQRAVVERYVIDERARQRYLTAPGKIALLRALLDPIVFDANQTYELQCLGVVLGDAFVEHLDMKWVMVCDEYGRDPAVALPGSDVLLFPLTMISKRVEAGEEVDVLALFNAIVGDVDEIG